MIKRTIVLVSPSLSAGGAERVMSLLANSLVTKVEVVYLVLLTKGEHFYELDPRVKVVEPDFRIQDIGRVIFTLRSFFWLRSLLMKLQASAALSFGGKYNAFVLLSAMGMGLRLFISDRSRPTISYGWVLDRINPILYRSAAGIVAQTERAKLEMYRLTKHKNIKVIPNPVPQVPRTNQSLQKVIINIGRFIASKHQDWLLDYFESIGEPDWMLLFLGDGPKLKEVYEMSMIGDTKDNIKFLGNVKNVSAYYGVASVFAFTSVSEGFPNTLAEAMAHGCACIAYDCVAGPADLIDDGVNGFLIPLGDDQLYRRRLKELMQDATLRERFGEAARIKMKEFEAEKVTQRYLEFITS